MADLLTLEKIRETATALDGCGLSTLDDLRLWISKDVDQSIPRLAKSSQTAESLLMALVIAEYCDNTGRGGRKKLGAYWRGLKPFPTLVKLYWIALGLEWRQNKIRTVTKLGGPSWHISRQMFTRHWRLWYNWRRHWADGLLLIVLPALLIGLWFRVESAKNSQVQSVAVKRSANVSAFQRIGDEVELARVHNTSGAFTAIDQVRGLYSLVPLAGGAPVLTNQLLNKELSNQIQHRSILSIPLKAGTYVRDLSPPCEGVLLLSPRETESASVASETAAQKHEFEIVLLAIDKSGDAVTATVAMSAEDVKKAGALLGSCDAYLSKSAR